MVEVEFNAPLDTIYVISEAVFTANHLTDTDKQNRSRFCYTHDAVGTLEANESIENRGEL